MSAPWPLRAAVVLRCRVTGGNGQRGSVAVVMPILAVGMLSMGGLVIDGGTALAARGRAADLAQQAARAGADVLSPGSLRRADPDSLVIDPGAASAAAQQILSAGAVGGQSAGELTSEVDVAGDSVTVRVSITRPTAMLSAVGVGSVTGTFTATATVLHGAVTQDGG